MEIWLDTCILSVIQHATERGLLFGVTTNPSILATAQKSPVEVLKALLEIQKGPVTAQVTASSANEMVEQGRRLHHLSSRIIVKIPATSQGLIAIHALAQEKVPIMATVIYDPLQAVAAFQAGALYAAIYVGRMEDAQLRPFETLKMLQTYIDSSRPACKLIAASIRTKEHMVSCLQAGCAAMTLSEKAYGLFMADHPLTTKNSEDFSLALPVDWL